MLLVAMPGAPSSVLAPSVDRELSAQGLDRLRRHPVGRAHHPALGAVDLRELRGHSEVCQPQTWPSEQAGDDWRPQ